MNTVERIRELTRPTGEEDLLAVEYPKPRIRVELKTALIAVSVVLVSAVIWALSRPTPQQPPWEATADEALAAPPSEVVVSVVGEVANPGLVTLPQGSRVANALEVAEPHPDADLIVLNQAQLLVDGQQIHVQAIGAAPIPSSDNADSNTQGLVSLNTASAEELTSLPGVGEATAAAIISHRESNGPFSSVEQIMDVKGIGPAKFEALKDLVSI